ncbi:WYL domain-containing protein [Pseudomonas alkylphenolica]|uniref:WYL domain-containing protein n=1 Tax=Pseudomonas alkylphenolica TaxID=237609 RepID=UPI0018D8597D|nr:WYL domain-containing protein [Pseudomonas alkylphenolica]MBH3430430.1 WYL domain-containing protein [Pseudomonas alkylphenolica]
MPSATTRATLSRQWELLRQLPSRSPGITSAEMVARLQDAGFSISKRSIERDLNELSLIFPLERNDKSIPYGWHWAATAYGDMRQQAVQRFRQLRTPDNAADGLRDVDLQACLLSEALQPVETDRIELQLWISDNLARQVRDAPLAADMQFTQLERGQRLRAVVSNSWQLRWWLLSQGDSLIVEQPLALRQQIADTLSNAAAQYSD